MAADLPTSLSFPGRARPSGQGTLSAEPPDPPRQEFLRQRLARRRGIELEHHKGRRAHGRGDFALRHDRVVGPILRAALRVAGIYGRGVSNALKPELRRIRLAFPSLPAEFNGFRILHLADLHIDGVHGLAEVLAPMIRDCPADLCVMTGDYRFETDGDCSGVYPRMEKILAAVRSRHGTLGILGNHDISEIAVGLESLGVRMLINEAVSLGHGPRRLTIAGVDDPHYYGCDELELALRDVAADDFKILLAHTPEMFEEAAAAGIGLYLCGHTHGGQIRLPGIGAPLRNAACPSSYAEGLWRHREMRGFTSRGAGSSLLPIRYNCPPEITLIELATSLG